VTGAEERSNVVGAVPDRTDLAERGADHGKLRCADHAQAPSRGAAHGKHQHHGLEHADAPVRHEQGGTGPRDVLGTLHSHLHGSRDAREHVGEVGIATELIDGVSPVDPSTERVDRAVGREHAIRVDPIVRRDRGATHATLARSVSFVTVAHS
jgi:hypothetical protein